MKTKPNENGGYTIATLSALIRYYHCISAGPDTGREERPEGTEGHIPAREHPGISIHDLYDDKLA
jgi:hypothetical protein